MIDSGLSRDFNALVAVVVGGAAGALTRWGLVEALNEPTGWPWAVFIVNVVGSFVLGWLAAGLVRRRSVPLHLGLATGFCGALTTFSGFAVDTAVFLRDDRMALATVYVLSSLAAGLVAVIAGHRLGTGQSQTGPQTS